MEKKQTALQQSTDNISEFLSCLQGILMNVRIPKYRKEELMKIGNDLYIKNEKLLEVDRQNHIDAFTDGINNVIPYCHSWNNDTYEYEYYTTEDLDPAEWFNQTFGTDDK